jgi:hypothetical protein
MRYNNYLLYSLYFFNGLPNVLYSIVSLIASFCENILNRKGINFYYWFLK